MTFILRVAQLALVLLPFLSQAQSGAVGLEIPAPATPRQGHFLTGAYVLGNYTPLPGTGSMSYGVQPYVRYHLGTKATARPFVQYSFAPYRLQSYRNDPAYEPGGAAIPANPGFAPLPLNNAGYGGFGSHLGGLSVGVPVRIGGSPAMLHVAGSVLGGLLR